LVAGGLTTTVGQCRLCTSVSLTLPRPTADSTPLHKRTGRVNLLVAKDVKMRGACSSPFEGSEAARADDGDVAVVRGGVLDGHGPREARHVCAEHGGGHSIGAALARLLGEASQRLAVARGRRVSQRLAGASQVV
jgi:hypothetical protein